MEMHNVRRDDETTSCDVDVAQAVAQINSYFAKYFRFRNVDAHPGGNTIVLTGYVLMREFRDQAYGFAELVGKPIRNNISIAYHLLALYHLIFDAMLVAAAAYIIDVIPLPGNWLVGMLHEFGTLIILVFLLLHLAAVLWKNLQH